MSAILQYTRDEMTTEPVRRTDLTALIQSVVDDMADAGMDVVFDPAPAVLVDCRSSALKRAITNLVDNAVKYGKKACGPRSTRRVRHDERAQGRSRGRANKGEAQRAGRDRFGQFGRRRRRCARSSGHVVLGLDRVADGQPDGHRRGRADARADLAVEEARQARQSLRCSHQGGTSRLISEPCSRRSRPPRHDLVWRVPDDPRRPCNSGLRLRLNVGARHMNTIGFLIIFAGAFTLGGFLFDDLRVFVRGYKAEARRHDDIVAKLMRAARNEWE